MALRDLARKARRGSETRRAQAGFFFFFSYSLFVMGFLACFGGDEQEQEDEFKMLHKKCGVGVGNFFFMLNEE